MFLLIGPPGLSRHRSSRSKSPLLLLQDCSKLAQTGKDGWVSETALETPQVDPLGFSQTLAEAISTFGVLQTFLHRMLTGLGSEETRQRFRTQPLPGNSPMMLSKPSPLSQTAHLSGTLRPAESLMLLTLCGSSLKETPSTPDTLVTGTGPLLLVGLLETLPNGGLAQM